ncbi:MULTISPECIES: hypothetical protein [Rhodococcus]|uniref:hypothetical protein n=1 Tax=Rhodococcus TaxID=1827 RepID=UPI000AC4485F|nr:MULTISPECIES: hypothetical protein [Rhodococcus]
MDSHNLCVRATPPSWSFSDDGDYDRPTLRDETVGHGTSLSVGSDGEVDEGGE